jgi:hypothetical protein
MSLTTIWNVLNNTVTDHEIKRGIEIPMIQRDYAQGRRNSKASEIRKVFLSKLLSTIEDVIEKDSPPLELDFVYGYIETETFIPLDGQQRLTTLYLLHWYFAFKEQKLSEFKTPLSKFSYQTRQSSEDFLKRINGGLSAEDHKSIFEQNKTFESVITDKNWYFVNWKYDLTIQSVITMLDEIHGMFNASGIAFKHLISETKPCIVFNFLNINTFGLSDDLYIKMNARGKPLTNFENLKAELGKFIELSDFNTKYDYKLKHSGGYKSVDVETYFITKTDTSWSDFFWGIRNSDTNEFDDKLLNLLAFVALNELIKGDINLFDKCIGKLENNSDLSYYKFQSLGLLNEQSIISYINTLDLLVSENEIVKDYFDYENYLDKEAIVTSSYVKNFEARYPQRILFYASFKFLIANKGKTDLEELKKWDRLIRNLVFNTIYNKAKDYQDSILDIDGLIAAYDGDIYSTFNSYDVKGFESQQIKEEKLKIELLRLSDEWRHFILDAESHPYLTGQIIFLLSYSGIYDKYLANQLSWNKTDESNYLEIIQGYYRKFKKMFDDNGLRNFTNELFRRALLSIGDYRLYSTNYSLVINNHRDVSWKRLLKETGNRTNSYWHKEKCQYLKELFDKVNIEDVDAALKEIISNSECSDWRKDFIKHPILIKTSSLKYLKFFDNGDIYLLRKSKYNKYEDPEFKSILLKKSLQKEGFDEKDIELGYIDALNQYGIIRIKNYRPKVVFNYDGNKQFLIRQKGKEDVFSKSLSAIVKYIVENF